jgi:hypothetical protein
MLHYFWLPRQLFNWSSFLVYGCLDAKWGSLMDQMTERQFSKALGEP